MHQGGRILIRFGVDYFAGGARHSTPAHLGAQLGRSGRRRGEAVPVVYRDRPIVKATWVGEWNVPWWSETTEWFLGVGG